jgi:hypothetical protein
MKLYQLLEAKNELGFDEKYTREDNPEVYNNTIILSSGNVSSFDEFPKKLSCSLIVLNRNKFTNFDRFPRILF